VTPVLNTPVCDRLAIVAEALAARAAGRLPEEALEDRGDHGVGRDVLLSIDDLLARVRESGGERRSCGRGPCWAGRPRHREGREYSFESLWMSLLPARSADLARAAVSAR
jgi:hypothetical protein